MHASVGCGRGALHGPCVAARSSRCTRPGREPHRCRARRRGRHRDPRAWRRTSDRRADRRPSRIRARRPARQRDLTGRRCRCRGRSARSPIRRGSPGSTRSRRRPRLVEAPDVEALFDSPVRGCVRRTSMRTGVRCCIHRTAVEPCRRGTARGGVARRVHRGQQGVGGGRRRCRWPRRRRVGAARRPRVTSSCSAARGVRSARRSASELAALARIADTRWLALPRATPVASGQGPVRERSTARFHPA